MAQAAGQKRAADYETKRTRNHNAIRRWAEKRGGRPTMVEGTQILRIDFDDPDVSRDESFSIKSRPTTGISVASINSFIRAPREQDQVLRTRPGVLLGPDCWPEGRHPRGHRAEHKRRAALAAGSDLDRRRHGRVQRDKQIVAHSLNTAQPRAGGCPTPTPRPCQAMPWPCFGRLRSTLIRRTTLPADRWLSGRERQA